MKLLYFFSFMLISFSAAGQVDYPPCSAFDTIGKDTLRVINSHSNSLYAGIDNMVEIRHLPRTNLLVECVAGVTMEEDTGLYNVIPALSGFTNIIIYQCDTVDTIVCFQKKMRVLRLPQPYITLERTIINNDCNIYLKQLEKVRKFEVHLSDDLVDDSKWFKIKSIEIGYPVGQLYVTKINEGTVISQDIIKLLSSIPSGTELKLIFTLEGNGDVFKRLSPIKVKLF